MKRYCVVKRALLGSLFSLLFFISLSILPNYPNLYTFSFNYSKENTPDYQLIQALNHRPQTSAIAFSPNQHWLASAYDNGIIYLWNLADIDKSPLKSRLLKAHKNMITSLVFTADSQYLFSVALDENIIMWEIKSGLPIKKGKFTIKNNKATLILAVSADGQYLAAAGIDQKIRVWDIAKGELLQIIKSHKKAISHLAFSPTGKLASASWDGEVHLWHWVGQKLEKFKYFKYPDPVFKVIFSADEKFLFAGTDGTKVYSENLETSERKELFKLKSWVSGLVSSQDNQWIAASAGSNQLAIYNRFNASKKLINVTETWFSKLTLSPDNKWLAASANNGAVWIYDFPQGTPLHLLVKGELNNDYLSCHYKTNQCFKSVQYKKILYVFISLSFLIAILIFFYYEYKQYCKNHPFNINLSKNPQALLTLSIHELKIAKKILSRTKRLNIILDACDINLKILKQAITFTKQKPEKQIKQLTHRLQAKLNAIDQSNYQLIFNDDFLINLKQVSIYFPKTTDSKINILEHLKTYSHNDFVIIISLKPNHQKILKPIADDMNKRCIIPSLNDLSSLLLDPEPILRFSQIIARQLRLNFISPYRLEGGVNNNALFFGRSDSTFNIFNHEIKNYVIVGARGIGKTSLLQYLYDHYQKQEQTKVYFLTLNNFNLIESLNAALGLENQSTPEKIKDYLKENAKKYLFLIDEVDDFIAHEKENNYQTLKWLRHLNAENNCCFILAGYWDLYLEAVFNYHSPLKNFAETICLGQLEYDACQQLIIEPLNWVNVDIEKKAVDYLIKQTGQRANLIAISCFEMLNALNIKTRLLTQKDVEKIILSDRIYQFLEGWRQLTKDDNEQQNKLIYNIVVLTIKQDSFTCKEVCDKLPHQSFEISSVQEALDLLEISFILNVDHKRCYSYCVPIFKILFDDVE